MNRTKSRLVAALLVLTFLAGGWVPVLAASKEIVPVDLNKADARELTTLPGIGEAMAKRILEFRAANGPFKRVEDLLKIKGIGEKSFEKLRPHVRVGQGK